MTDRELMQMALDALEHFEDEYGWGMQQKKAQRNLQIRLAQPETYPENFIDALRFDTALREPVAWMDEKGILWNSVTNPKNYTPLYTAPPRKEWVGLTDKDREWCDEHSHGNTSWAKQKAYGRAIEAKLKEKNGAA